MRPRRIITPEEATEILDHAVAEQALAVVSLQQDDGWHTFKSRVLERDRERKFVVLDYHDPRGRPLPELSPGQYAGVSFRHKSRKIMFATVVEAKGRFSVNDQVSVPALRYRWPERMTELQRRAYYRTPVPCGCSLLTNLWPGGVRARQDAQGTTLDVVSGQAVDLSCGGSLVRINQIGPLPWSENQTLGAELHLPDGHAALVVNAYYRGSRHDEEDQLCVAIQFVGFELTIDGNTVLQRLAACVQQFNRRHLSGPQRGRQARFRSR